MIEAKLAASPATRKCCRSCKSEKGAPRGLCAKTRYLSRGGMSMPSAWAKSCYRSPARISGASRGSAPTRAFRQRLSTDFLLTFVSIRYRAKLIRGEARQDHAIEFIGVLGNIDKVCRLMSANIAGPNHKRSPQTQKPLCGSAQMHSLSI